MNKILPITLAFAGLAAAHPGHGASGFVAGLAHPWTGIDHILALVAAGAWAFRTGGNARRLAPPLFLLAMAAGFLLSRTESVLPGLETWTLAGAVGLAFAAILGGRTSLVLPMALAAAFLHGAAHGTEIPLHSSGAGFLPGFLTSAAVLQFSGGVVAVGMGRFFLRASAPAGRSPTSQAKPESV